jgi:glyoxylase-like metal-dependent hydrolase (beta-lactamase superfamily II)
VNERPVPGTRTVVDQLVVGPFQENTFLLRGADSSEVIIIDPGDEAERIAQVLDNHSWQPVAIVNTHGHLDHVGAIQPLKIRYDIPFYMHPGDRFILANAPESARRFGVPEPSVPDVDHELSDHAILNLAGLELNVIHTPGHTPGGVSLAVDGRLFAGDTLFAGSVGRTDLPGGNTSILIKSLLERLMALPDETIVHCGHGPDTQIGHERLTNPYLVEGSFLM